MSRVFDANSSNFLSIASLSLSTNQSWSFCAYVKPDTLNGVQVAVSIADDSATLHPRIAARTDDNNTVGFFEKMDTDTAQAINTTATLSIGSWQLIVGVYDNSAGPDIIVYANSISGTGTGTRGGSVTDTMNRITVGVYADSTPASPFDGNIAQVIVWEGLALTSSNVTSLLDATSTAGMGAVQSGSILCHYPLDDANLSDETATLSDLTVNGTVASDTDDPFAAGGVTIPVFENYYRSMRA